MSNLLLVVDMQEGFRYENVEKLIPKIKSLTNKFKGDIIFTCFENLKDSQFEEKIHWKKFQNKKDKKILNELEYISYRKLIHSTLTLLNKELLNIIKLNNYKTIYVSGIYLDICISKFVMDCFDKELNVKIIMDCVTSQDSKNDEIFINSLKRVIGKQDIIKLENLK